MNKLLIVLLAVCLVSVHAFVKRDAPAAPSSDLQTQFDQLRIQIEALSKDLTQQAAQVLDPEAIKKNLDDLVAKAKDALDKLKPTEEVKPAA